MGNLKETGIQFLRQNGRQSSSEWTASRLLILPFNMQFWCKMYIYVNSSKHTLYWSSDIFLYFIHDDCLIVVSLSYLLAIWMFTTTAYSILYIFKCKRTRSWLEVTVGKDKPICHTKSKHRKITLRVEVESTKFSWYNGMQQYCIAGNLRGKFLANLYLVHIIAEWRIRCYRQPT